MGPGSRLLGHTVVFILKQIVSKQDLYNIIGLQMKLPETEKQIEETPAGIFRFKSISNLFAFIFISYRFICLEYIYTTMLSESEVSAHFLD